MTNEDEQENVEAYEDALTMQIRDSELADRLTLLRICLPVTYEKLTSSS